MALRMTKHEEARTSHGGELSHWPWSSQHRADVTGEKINFYLHMIGLFVHSHNLLKLE